MRLRPGLLVQAAGARRVPVGVPAGAQGPLEPSRGAAARGLTALGGVWRPGPSADARGRRPARMGSPASGARCRATRGAEVLAEGVGLALVRGADALAVQDVQGFDHALEREPTDALAVLDHERDVVGPDLQGGPRSCERPAVSNPNPGSEEPGTSKPVIRRELDGGFDSRGVLLRKARSPSAASRYRTPREGGQDEPQRPESPHSARNRTGGSK